MNPFQINVDVDGKIVTVKWSDFNEFVMVIIGTQKQLNKQQIEKAYNYLFNHFSIFGLYNKLPPKSTILDIGSGISIIDLIAHQTIEDSKFYLVDKNQMEVTMHTASDNPYFARNYRFYNMWGPVHDAITTTGLNPENFIFLNPSDAWPVRFNAITSFASWCWHYPLDIYWDRVKNSLLPNGKLYIQISNWAIEETPTLLEIISDHFRCNPTKKAIERGMIRNNPKLLIKNNCYGYYCMWTNNNI